jgi:hypothetical protein
MSKPNAATRKRTAARMRRAIDKARKLTEELNVLRCDMVVAGMSEQWVGAVMIARDSLQDVTRLGWTSVEVERYSTAEEADRAAKIEHWQHVWQNDPNEFVRHNAELALACLGVPVR